MKKKLIFALFLFVLFLSSLSNAQVSCTIDTHSWDDGYLANISLTNTSENTIDSWSVIIQLNQSAVVNSYWSAVLEAQDNSIHASNEEWNGTLQPGEQVWFGFTGKHAGNFHAPECFANNKKSALASYLRRGLLNQLQQRSYYPQNPLPTPAPGGSSSTSTSSSTSSSSSSSSSGSAPQPEDITNTQEEGVDEADIIESDGTNLFVVKRDSYLVSSSSTSSSSSSSSSTSSSTSSGSSNYMGQISLTAYQTNRDEGTSEKVGSATFPFSKNAVSVSGTYFRRTAQTNLLAIVSNNYNYHSSWWTFGGFGYIPYFQVSNTTAVTFADVSDPTNMEKIHEISFDSALVSSRRIDNMLYLVTRYSPSLSRLGFELGNSSTIEGNTKLVNQASADDLMPHIYSSDGTSKPILDAENCTLPESTELSDTYTGSLLLLTRINLDNTDDISSLCLAASATDIYASANAVYAFSYAYSNQMKIYKFSIGDKYEFRGATYVPGYIPCSTKSYCFGENNGVLRVLSKNLSNTHSDTQYELRTIKESSTDNALETIAVLPNEKRPDSIGKPGELVYSMRSFGDYAYIVTFDKVDPLYAVNFSDPSDPYIAGALEVEGFSNYLHPVGDKYLVGIGKHAIYDEYRKITWYQGVKVELFDISDPTALRSLGSEIIGKRGSQTTVNYDPRAFSLVSDESGIRFTLPIQVNDRLPLGGNPDILNTFYGWNFTALYAFEIDTSGADASLNKLGILKAREYGPNTSYPSPYYNDRGVIFDQALYYLHNFNLYSSLIEDLEQPE